MNSNTLPFYGFVILNNGLKLFWLRHAASGQEAVRIVTAQHVHVSECYLTDKEGNTL